MRKIQIVAASSLAFGICLGVIGMGIAHRTGAKFTHVPYKGGAEWMQALMGGEIAMIFGEPATIIQHVKSGKMNIDSVMGIIIPKEEVERQGVPIAKLHVDYEIPLE